MSLKNLLVGHQVRRTGAQFNTRNTGVVVERVTYPMPITTEGLTSEEFATEFNLAKSMPAQLKIYWTLTGLITEELETEVDGNYPGGNAYRAWDREFPLFAVETGGYGDISVITPDGEAAVFDMPERVGLASETTTEDYIEQVVRAVRAYLTKTVPPYEREPQETDDAGQYENAS